MSHFPKRYQLQSVSPTAGYHILDRYHDWQELAEFGYELLKLVKPPLRIVDTHDGSIVWSYPVPDSDLDTDQPEPLPTFSDEQTGWFSNDGF